MKITEKKTEVVLKPIDPAEIKNPLFGKFGPVFVTTPTGRLTLNERRVAATCATDHLVKFDDSSNTFERFDRTEGVWRQMPKPEVHRLVDQKLLEFGKQYDCLGFVHQLKSSHLNSIARMLQPYEAEVERKSVKGHMHVSNGVLDMSGNAPKLLPHGPQHDLRVRGSVTYNAKAKCPRFLKELLEAALDKEDIALIQKYCGSMLLGENIWQAILILLGNAATGKSTFARIMETLLGEDFVAQLLTKHLAGRFETSSFLGKRLLVGKDVPGETLAETGARMLKSLVGGDLMHAEIKYRGKAPIRGDYHVIITSNNRLRIALDADEDAWRRRLLVVEFTKPKPKKPIANFAEQLIAEEGSGILNWLVEGAMASRAEMKKYGKLQLSEAQKERIDTLITDSDNVRTFVKKRVMAADGDETTSEALLKTYYETCKERGWTPVGERAFQKRVPDLLLENFNVCRRNDIQHEGKAVRGYKDIALI